ncbi:MAG TPA: ornithine carbamoyltransferase [Acidimicrobiia bacterium]|jgi:ornithine carbamoyltransferase
MNCLELDDLDPPRLASLIERAVDYKRDTKRIPRPLEGRGVALLFEKPSARTRSSSEMAVVTLGGHPIYVRGEEVGLDTRETVEDVARTFACYCSVIMARTFAHDTVERIASAVDVPVVNLLSDVAHPTQALADVLTLHEQWGSVDGRRLAYIGDGNNMAASLAFVAALSGLELVVASPPGYELADTVVEAARNLGGVIELTTEPTDAVDGADAIYTDVWTSMGQEAERDTRRAAFARYQVDAALVKAARPDAVVLHCLPAHRGEEIATEVIDGPHSIVWRQAANRMDALRALLVDLLGAA